MRRSITSLVLAAVALLVVTASVAAADPFGWGHRGTASVSMVSRGYDCCSMGWTAANGNTRVVAASNPTPSAHPTAAPVQTQTHATPTQRPAATHTVTHHATTSHRAITQTSRHGSGCDDGGHDSHSGSWH
jgi:hypothetical protein